MPKFLPRFKSVIYVCVCVCVCIKGGVVDCRCATSRAGVREILIDLIDLIDPVTWGCVWETEEYMGVYKELEGMFAHKRSRMFITLSVVY